MWVEPFTGVMLCVMVKSSASDQHWVASPAKGRVLHSTACVQRDVHCFAANTYFSHKTFPMYARDTQTRNSTSVGLLPSTCQRLVLLTCLPIAPTFSAVLVRSWILAPQQTDIPTASAQQPRMCCVISRRETKNPSSYGRHEQHLVFVCHLRHNYGYLNAPEKIPKQRNGKREGCTAVTSRLP